MVSTDLREKMIRRKEDNAHTALINISGIIFFLIIFFLLRDLFDETTRKTIP